MERILKCKETLFGTDEDNSCIKLLIACGSGFLILIRAVNWGYLCLHYNGIYQVPVALLTPNDSLLVSLAIGLIGILIIFAIAMIEIHYITTLGIKKVFLRFCVGIIGIIIIALGTPRLLYIVRHLGSVLSGRALENVLTFFLMLSEAFEHVGQLTKNLMFQYAPFLLGICAIIMEIDFVFKYYKQTKRSVLGTQPQKRKMKEKLGAGFFLLIKIIFGTIYFLVVALLLGLKNITNYVPAILLDNEEMLPCVVIFGFAFILFSHFFNSKNKLRTKSAPT
ncbi:MAG: hypothetical protein LUG55_07325 [Clostridiales bacterium]|nr:hypothetical protein [Clostridiales bacterium]